MVERMRGKVRSVEDENRIEKNKIFAKLIDPELEQHLMQLKQREWDLLHRMKNEELTVPELHEIQTDMQPQSFLHHITFEADKAEILQPNNQLLANQRSTQLVKHMAESHTRSIESSQSLVQGRRFGFGGNFRLSTMGIFRDSRQQKLKGAVKDAIRKQRPSLISLTEKTSAPSNRKSDRQSQAKLSSRAKDDFDKSLIEKNTAKIIYLEDNQKEAQIDGSKKCRPHPNTREQEISKAFSRTCIQEEKVVDLPAFAKVKDSKLQLVNYPLNCGLCKAMGQYLINSSWRINLSYILLHLHLDNNRITDSDFANILKGVCVQQQLSSLTYSRNEFGKNSIDQLSELINIQNKT